MKEAIEKAIKNGFDITQFTQNELSDYVGVKEQTSPYFLEFDFGNGRTSDISTYAIIFGTDFIDKLVGKRKLCNKEPVAFCDTVRVKDRIDFTDDGTPIKGKCDFYDMADARGSCLYEASTETAIHYHLATMANIKDIDKLKEYVRTLI